MRSTPLALIAILGCFILGQACGSDDEPASTNTNHGDPCASSGTCAPPFPYCAAGLCVECVGDNNCDNGRSCNLDSHTCVECTSDGQCPQEDPYCSASG